jgi:hypothetical protein
MRISSVAGFGSLSSCWIILSLLQLISVASSRECTGLSAGLTPNFNDVISKGRISSDWVFEAQIETNPKRQRKVEQKESEYMYLSFEGPGQLEEKDFGVTDKAKDLYMTLFKVNKVKENYFTVSLLYFCSPLTHSMNQIIMEINPPNCPKVEISWFKVCGDMMGNLALI